MSTLLARHRHRRRGFSLVELAVVLIVIGVIAAIAIPTFSAVIDRATDKSVDATAVAILHDAAALAALGDDDDDGSAYVLDDLQTSVDELPTASAPGVSAAAAGVNAAGPEEGWTLITDPDEYSATYGEVHGGLSADNVYAGVALRSPTGHCIYARQAAGTIVEHWITDTDIGADCNAAEALDGTNGGPGPVPGGGGGGGGGGGPLPTPDCDSTGSSDPADFYIDCWLDDDPAPGPIIITITGPSPDTTPIGTCTVADSASYQGMYIENDGDGLSADTYCGDDPATTGPPLAPGEYTTTISWTDDDGPHSTSTTITVGPDPLMTLPAPSLDSPPVTDNLLYPGGTMDFTAVSDPSAVTYTITIYGNQDNVDATCTFDTTVEVGPPRLNITNLAGDTDAEVWCANDGPYSAGDIFEANHSYRFSITAHNGANFSPTVNFDYTPRLYQEALWGTSRITGAAQNWSGYWDSQEWIDNIAQFRKAQFGRYWKDLASIPDRDTYGHVVLGIANSGYTFVKNSPIGESYITYLDPNSGAEGPHLDDDVICGSNPNIVTATHDSSTNIFWGVANCGGGPVLFSLDDSGGLVFSSGYAAVPTSDNMSVASDNNGNLYLATYDAVYKYNTNTDTWSTEASSLAMGDGWSNVSAAYYNNRVYVGVDNPNHVVYSVNLTSGTKSIFAGQVYDQVEVDNGDPWFNVYDDSETQEDYVSPSSMRFMAPEGLAVYGGNLSFMAHRLGWNRAYLVTLPLP